ncbi:16S rRNA (guanine(966)-N(2))-methyltransferase RsmD [Mangrovitalea sediminis]|uniref:16S rRNA (guanine(966)-N(2))-methyltransferase RsmD n=1 Tax=Mangrovitalea sediminis TaxID=1982043 RepID=UPI000BE5584E|nr:16S rRNA (guanine(966)-N(2))-methyltransferase RsmD [Mangrovitalea sediminis]
MCPPRPQKSQRPGRGRRDATAAESRLRIIGGQWRSRQISFPCTEGLRPTPDRVRETLFNWLAAYVPGSRCLDLFAGSGALGLEALSREASSATFVDANSQSVQALRHNLNQLGLADDQRATVIASDALAYLRAGATEACDIIFLDPPFRQGWLERLLPLLESGGWVHPGSWVYIEHERELVTPSVPPRWQSYRRKEAGQVVYTLYQIPSQPQEGTTP